MKKYSIPEMAFMWSLAIGWGAIALSASFLAVCKGIWTLR